MSKIGFIGVGNMGGALARAVRREAWPKDMVLTNRTFSKAKALADELGCTAVTDNSTIARDCFWIFLGVKPQMMGELLEEIRPTLAERTSPGQRFVLVSMAAGMSTEKIQSLAGGDYPVIRIMPNTPVGIGKGMTPFCYTENLSGADLKAFLTLMEPTGRMDPIPEKLMDAAGALSGCGPAFTALFLEALADGGVACGLPRKQALEYAAQTVLGTAQLMLDGQHPALLKDAVCSPGGTTIRGVQKMEEAGFRGATMDAVLAAFEKTAKLSH